MTTRGKVFFFVCIFDHWALYAQTLSSLRAAADLLNVGCNQIWHIETKPQDTCTSLDSWRRRQTSYVSNNIWWSNHLLPCRSSFRHACVFPWSTGGPSSEWNSSWPVVHLQHFSHLCKVTPKRAPDICFRYSILKFPSGRLKNLIRLNQIGKSLTCSYFILQLIMGQNLLKQDRLVRPENRTYGQTQSAVTD